MTTSARICTSNRPGDKLVARVSESSGPGASKIPPGSTVVLEVAQIQYDNAHPENSQIVYPGTGATATSAGGLEKIATNSKSSDMKKVAAGAIAGAILGQVLGKSTKGTVIGAAGGAAAGAAVAGATRKYEACLPAGAPLHVTLGAA
jgi:Glycine zipper 2TM domain